MSKRKESTQREVEAKLRYFTEREDGLMGRLRAIGLTSDALPYRLQHWRTLVGDPIIYLSNLSDCVEDAEKDHQRKTA
jgi:hypothetical protein